jgi:hypothetical protein
MIVRVSSITFCASLTLACVDLGRTVDTPAHVAMSVTRGEGATRVVERLRGPARVRRLSQTTLLAVARIVRNDFDGPRRGDLYMRAVTAFPVEDGRFVGDVGTLGIDYVETTRTGAVLRYSGGGRARLDLSPLTGGAQLAFELSLALVQGGGVPLTVRGTIVSDGGAVANADLGAGIWLELFDPLQVLASPELDFEVFAAGEGGAWIASTPSEAPPGYGHFEFGAAGEVGFEAVDTDTGAGDTVDVGPNFPSPPTGSGGGFGDDGSSYDSYDDDADGGCQGDKASQDSSQCAVRGRGGWRGVSFGAALVWVACLRVRHRRRRSARVIE